MARGRVPGRSARLLLRKARVPRPGRARVSLLVPRTAFVGVSRSRTAPPVGLERGRVCFAAGDLDGAGLPALFSAAGVSASARRTGDVNCSRCQTSALSAKSRTATPATSKIRGPAKRGMGREWFLDGLRPPLSDHEIERPKQAAQQLSGNSDRSRDVIRDEWSGKLVHSRTAPTWCTKSGFLA
jgi:hypothetical protein